MSRIVLGLDPAGNFGWAAHDLDKPFSAIESDSLKLQGETVFDKIFQLRAEFVPLLRQYKPIFAGLESPFKFAPRFTRKSKDDIFGRNDSEPPSTGKVLGMLRSGHTIGQIAGICGCRPDDVMAALEPGSINPATISDCGQIAGAATALCLAWNIHCAQFQPRTWQAIIPKSIYSQFSGEGAPKKRAKAFCDALRINSPNIDSRDAALIAIYTAGCREFKLMQAKVAA